MNETVNLTKMDGASIAATLICYFENVNNKKQYLYYTLNEINGTDTNSTVKIYCAKVRQNDPALDEPINESTWEQLKGHMAEALKGTINPDIKFLPISALKDQTIVSEKVIAMPVSYDYVNKHYKFYIDNISSDSSIIEPVVVEPASEPIAPLNQVEEIKPNVEPVVETAETNVVAPTPEVIEPVINEPAAPVVENHAETSETNTLTPIDLASIEEKYTKMIEDINKLKEQELEAAKRYNATIQLSTMHNEQHASYVQNEQTKEVEAPVPPVGFEPQPIDPAPIEPIVQQTTQESTSQSSDIETNWFDMPIQ